MCSSVVSSIDIDVLYLFPILQLISEQLLLLTFKFVYYVTLEHKFVIVVHRHWVMVMFIWKQHEEERTRKY